MKFRGYIVFLYGILLVVGGLMGYLKANSLPSLIAGGGSGLLTIASAWAMLKHKPVGNLGAVILAFALTAFFSYRFYLTMSFMPAGMMALLSIVMVIMLTSAKKQPQYRKQ